MIKLHNLRSPIWTQYSWRHWRIRWCGWLCLYLSCSHQHLSPANQPLFSYSLSKPPASEKYSLLVQPNIVQNYTVLSKFCVSNRQTKNAMCYHIPTVACKGILYGKTYSWIYGVISMKRLTVVCKGIFLRKTHSCMHGQISVVRFTDAYNLFYPNTYSCMYMHVSMERPTLFAYE